MLSENSPLTYVYYMMSKTPEEIKEEYPYEVLERCSSCGEYVDKWIQTKFSFCDEYSCGLNLCENCSKELVNKFNEFIQK
jgi:hypothetical protein